ncbi:tyrosine--tRNA ligase [Mesomycoplasma neurolyticum]|uniref:Tyrosine--tRNA ligase n=1 Tax=Mesomycoplasma neurolyticum TaxID=2120 RepID=A0A449A6B7_9BACT|nr:tyrosine--tRNA ligase [Mesomycoplasma neurolyticum]VEU59801.1 tyrosyl tRNA synthetase [Mesomycoplasma neurolyticum]
MKQKKEFLKELKNRGILNNISSEEKFLNLKNFEGIYAGFDPTAISLHLGNYIQICTLKRFQNIGIKILAIVGGATGMIGDPSFKSKERVLLDQAKLLENKNAIIKQLQKFNLKVFDNLEIYKDMNVLDFLRDVGKNVNISYMLAKESIANRIDKGLSFTEFSYQLIQSWDFCYLYKHFDIKGQLGGSDQWGNITSGIEMIKKNYGEESNSFAITTNLLTDKNNVKFGKSTGGGSLWLDPKLTSPFMLYQFLVNQEDLEVEKLLKYLTFLSLDEISNIMFRHDEQKKLKIAQKTLAFEVVKDIHGAQEANNAIKISDILFNNQDFSLLTTNDLAQLENAIPCFSATMNENLSDFLIKHKIVVSKREMREFIEKNALKFNNSNITTENNVLLNKEFDGKYSLIKKGKKNYYLVKFLEK